MSEPLKNVLIEGNRYEDVVNMLCDIVKTACNDFPLHHPYIDGEGKTHWRVNGDKVREQANLMLELLENNSTGDTDEDFTHLRAYTRSNLEVYMINYAVAVSHNIESEHNIEIIRQLSVLANIVECWGEINRGIPWYIPEPWYKERD